MPRYRFWIGCFVAVALALPGIAWCARYLADLQAKADGNCTTFWSEA